MKSENEILEEFSKLKEDENFEEALSLCQHIDHTLYRQSERMHDYVTTAEETVMAGKTTEEATEVIAHKTIEAIHSFLDDFKLDIADENTLEAYCKVIDNTALSCKVSDDGYLSFTLECNGEEFPIKNGKDLTKTISLEVAIVQAEMENEKSADKEDDYELDV